MALNPDKIQPGDQVVLSFYGSDPVDWTVIDRHGTTIRVEHGGDVKTVPLSGKRSAYQIIGHRAWLPS